MDSLLVDDSKSLSLESDPQYADTLQRLRRAEEEQHQKENELYRLERRLGRDREERLSRAVEAIAAGESADQAITSGLEETPPEIVQLRTQVDALAAARKRIEAELNGLRLQASERIVARLLPRYIEIGQRQREAALDLIAAVEAEESFIRDLEGGGIYLGRLSQRLAFNSSHNLRQMLERLEEVARDSIRVDLETGLAVPLPPPPQPKKRPTREEVRAQLRAAGYNPDEIMSES